MTATFKQPTILSLLLLNIFLVATSMSSYSNTYPVPSMYLLHLLNRPSALRRQSTLGASPTSGLVDVLMYGLAGIPVYKAVETLLPLLKFKKNQNNRDNGRVVNNRYKRDLDYAKQLERLLISVENALEKYGITDPQCQLRATCEIHRKNADKNFIKLVGEMRREIKNPMVVPLAKYVFEYYEEAAEHGEQLSDCQEKYSRCPHSLEYFYKQTKSKKTAVGRIPDSHYIRDRNDIM